jgi:hypothetical protein
VIYSSDGYRDNSHPSLLWSIAATGADVILPVAAVTSSSDERLTSDCSSLLIFTTVTAAGFRLSVAASIHSSIRQSDVRLPSYYWTDSDLDIHADIHKYIFIKL